MARAAMAIVAATLIAGSVETAAAQDDRAVFDDATAFAWGMGTFDASMLIMFAAVGMQICQGSDCVDYAGAIPAAGLGAGVLVGILAAITQPPSEAPVVLHNFVWPALGAAAIVLGGYVGISDDEDPENLGLIVAPAAAVGLGCATYAMLRREEIVYDPDQTAAAHFFFWAPMVVGLSTAILLAVTDDPEDAEQERNRSVLTSILAGALGLATWLGGVLWIEMQAD